MCIEKYLRKHGWLALLILALGSQYLFAVQPYQPSYGDPMLESWRWRTFPELSGLGAQCVAGTKDGSLWFGTEKALWCYDGIEWTNHPAVGGEILSMCFGTDGTLYVASRFEIQEFKGGQWSRIFSSDHQLEIRKITWSADGSLWAAASWGLLRWQQSKWTLFTGPEVAAGWDPGKSNPAVTTVALPPNVMDKARAGNRPTWRYNLDEIYADHEGRIWLGTAAGEILRFDPAGNAAATGAWSIFNETDGLACGRVSSILQLQNGMVWVVYGSRSGYLNVFDGVGWQKSRLTDAGAIGDCGHLMQTRDGTIWASGENWLGACRDGRWQTYRSPEVPLPEANNFLFQSSDGALWIGGPQSEILRVDYGTTHWVSLRDLNFQWESPAGAEWFLHRDGRVVVHKPTGEWMSYGVEDGLIDAPVLLLGTKSGDLWAAGSQEHTAATARFDGKKWTRFIHDDFSWGVDWRAAFESSDGSIWFGAAVDSGAKNHFDGILQFHDGQWVAHHQPGRFPPGATVTNSLVTLPPTPRPETRGKFLFIGESRDGKIWAGRSVLIDHDGHAWKLAVNESLANTHVSLTNGVRVGLLEAMLTSKEGDLWLGSRQYGAIRYDGRTWQQFQGKDSLVANSVYSLAQTSDGSIWAATDRGMSRFDGLSWTADVLPKGMNILEDSGNLKGTPSGKLWVNHFTRDWALRAWPKAAQLGATNIDLWTICHELNGQPPRTRIVSGATEVASPGNLSLFWSGTAMWQEPQASQLQYSYRLDNGPWSPYTFEDGHAFFSLASGQHHFEVRARDRDFNADPHPAALDFVVLPPVWRQAWFVLLIMALAGVIVAQTIRVLLEQGRLRVANRELENDIARRKHAEQELQQAKQQIQYILDNTKDVIFQIDLKGNYIYGNAAAERLTGYPLPQLLRMNMLELVAPEHHALVKERLRRRQANGELEGFFEFEILNKDGRRIWVELATDKVCDDAERLVAVQGVARDITERRRLEDHLRQAQKMEAVGRLAGGVAHDFNNILSAILMQTELISRSNTPREELEEGLRQITGAAERAANLTRQLLMFSRKQVMQARAVDLNEAVTGLAKMLQRIIGEDVRLQLNLHPTPVTTHADAGMLDQVLMNLAVNARDAMPDGGQLTIKTSEALVDEAQAQKYPDAVPGWYACISVRDTGCGIPADVLPRIFEPFFTTKQAGKGTGLGLATVFGVVKQHRGWLTVESKPGHGTTFQVFLPLTRATSASTEDPAKPQIRGGTETILLAEDDISVRKILCTTLSRRGYKVLGAASGIDAMKLWSRHQPQVALLLADLVMPGGMSGQQLARRLQADKPDLKVIYVSGYSAEIAGHEIQLRSGENFLQKPLRHDQILEMVRRCLDA